MKEGEQRTLPMLVISRCHPSTKTARRYVSAWPEPFRPVAQLRKKTPQPLLPWVESTPTFGVWFPSKRSEWQKEAWHMSIAVSCQPLVRLSITASST
jgi:hypothetical protein